LTISVFGFKYIWGIFVCSGKIFWRIKLYILTDSQILFPTPKEVTGTESGDLAFLIVATAVCSCGFCRIKVAFFGREEFVNREVKSVKELTGIAFYRLNAFILRNAEIYYRNNKLNISEKTCDGENTNSYKHLSAVGIVNKNVIKHLADIFRNGVYNYITTTATTIIMRINNLCCKTNGVYNFCL